MPLFASRKRQKQSSPFLRFFPEFYFCYGAFLRKVLGSELRELYWMCFRWFRVCVFVWFYLSDSGSSCFFAVLGTLGPLFRGSFSLSSSFFFPLSFLGPAWGLFLSLLCACCQDHLASSRQVRLSTCFFACCLFFLFSLPGSAPLSLALSFFLSLFFLSLSLLHAFSAPSGSCQCHTRIAMIKPCLSQRQRFTARLHMDH